MAKKARKVQPHDDSFKKFVEPEQIATLDNGIEIWKIKLDSLTEQEKNARSQAPEVFNRLRDTMKRDSRLESLPFVARSENSVEIISGHHRVRAARMAGLSDIFVMADTTGLSRSQVIAKQLSHNALQGHDDQNVLADLFQEMDDINDKLESGLDPRTLALINMEPVKIESIGVDFTTRLISFAFLPHKFDQFEELLKRIPKNTNTVGVLDIETFDKFKDVITKVGEIEDIRSIGSIMSKIIDITNSALDQQERENGEDQEDTHSTEAERSE